MHKLKFLIEQYGHLPKQGTDAWLQSRKTKIGGSEVAAVMGKSHFCTYDELIANKKAAQPLVTAACTFGRVFEIVAKQHLASKGDEIHELGAIPCSRYPVCYSPDGVLVVDDDLVLVEIKCPWRRKHIEEVPVQYMYQIQTGMSVLPCEKCVFLQFIFRLCRVEDLGFNERYNRYLHFDSKKTMPPSKPRRWGFVHFAADTDLIDMGRLEPDTADNLCIADTLVAEVHWESHDIPTSGYVMPFKLFHETALTVARDAGFLDRIGKTLWQTHLKLA